LASEVWLMGLQVNYRGVLACLDEIGSAQKFKVKGILAEMNAEKVTLGHLYNRASSGSILVLSQAGLDSTGYKLPQKVVVHISHSVADGKFSYVQTPHVLGEFGPWTSLYNSLSSLSLSSWGSLPDLSISS